MVANTILASGHYLGVRRSARNFSFTVPKIGQKVTDTDMTKWFNQLHSKKKDNNEPSKHEKGREKSTSFSGWIRVTNAVTVSEKCLAAPDIYRATRLGDPYTAEQTVKRFKQNAAKVLERCCKTQEAVTEATAAEINKYACLMQEITVVLLSVSDTKQPGHRFDQNTGKWYCEKSVRKFFTPEVPVDLFLIEFAKELADETTTVNAERKLVVTKKGQTKAGTNGYSYCIENVSAEEAMETDAKVVAAVERIRDKLISFSGPELQEKLRKINS